jgi:hypothetical protein
LSATLAAEVATECTTVSLLSTPMCALVCDMKLIQRMFNMDSS